MVSGRWDSSGSDEVAECRGILVVDDSEDIRVLLEFFLQDEGYSNLHMAASALEAFALLGLAPSASPPLLVDLILMDITMPEIDGIEAVRRIKLMPTLRDLPVIMVTARTEAEHLHDAFAAGATDYVTKPVNEVELLARVRSSLRLKQAMDELKQREKELLMAQRELEVANRKLQKLSSQDGLTGIANRRMFDQGMEREWSRCQREQEELSLILLDIDDFKQYNDSLGHQAGDDCLRTVAQALDQTMKRGTDLVARYGGEEFGVILPNTNHAGALLIANILVETLHDMALEHPGTPLKRITLSAGVASVVPQASQDPSFLIAEADRALFQAKRNGRNRVCVAPVSEVVM